MTLLPIVLTVARMRPHAYILSHVSIHLFLYSCIYFTLCTHISISYLYPCHHRRESMSTSKSISISVPVSIAISISLLLLSISAGSVWAGRYDLSRSLRVRRSQTPDKV